MNKIKHFRRVFSRFDKLARCYLGFLNFVSALIWLRRSGNKNKFVEVIMKPQARQGLKTIVFVLIAVALSGIGSPIPARSSSYAAIRQLSSSQLPEITAQNAVLLTRFATISPLITGDSLQAPRWSPDGKYLAVSGLNAIMLYNTSNFSAKPRIIYQASPTIMFSPNGTLLASVAYQDKSIHVYEVKSGKQLYRVQELSGVALDGRVDPTFSPDSSLLAVSNRSQIYILDSHTGKVITVVPGNQYNLSFSPDSSMIAAVESEAFQEAVTISEARTGVRLTGFRINNVSAATVIFSPSGTTIAVEFRGSDIVVFDIAAGKELSRMSPHNLDTAKLSFSPDGTMLAAFAPGKAFLWDLTTEHFSEFDYSDYDRYGGTFNKDNSLLLYWDYNENSALPLGNLLRIWSIPERRQLRLLEGALDPQFSPHGTMLATWGESGVVVWAVQQADATF